jgi:putative addiction module antidote
MIAAGGAGRGVAHHAAGTGWPARWEAGRRALLLKHPLQHPAMYVLIPVATQEPTMNTVIRKIGNSEGVILPKDLLQGLNLKAGDSVVVVRDGGGIVLRKAGDEFEEQMAAAREIMDRYKVALQKLAE